MNWITTSEFAKLADVSHQTAWRTVRDCPIAFKKRYLRVWLIEKTYALKWIEKRRQISIKPEEIAKIINRSNPFVRKLLKNTKPDFAKQLTNGRWIIKDCPEYRSWLKSLKIETEKKLRQEFKSGRNSLILNYKYIISYFKRWQNKVGGIDGPLNWSKSHQIQFLEDTIEVARQRWHIIKNLKYNDVNNIDINFLTKSEKFFYNEIIDTN